MLRDGTLVTTLIKSEKKKRYLPSAGIVVGGRPLVLSWCSLILRGATVREFLPVPKQKLRKHLSKARQWQRRLNFFFGKSNRVSKGLRKKSAKAN